MRQLSKDNLSNLTPNTHDNSSNSQSKFKVEEDLDKIDDSRLDEDSRVGLFAARTHLVLADAGER